MRCSVVYTARSLDRVCFHTVMANFGDDDGGWALRDHIQEILLEYAMQHLTVDYAELTSEMTNELLSPYLVEVPLYDRNALLLPIEPWVKLSAMHDLSNLTPWEEKFQIAADVAQYLRNTMRLRRGDLLTARMEEDLVKGATPIFIPDFPVLSRAARRNTPNLGAGLLSFTPRHHENMTSVAIQDEEGHETVVSVTEALELVWKMPASFHSAVSKFLKSAGALSRPSVTHRNTVLDPLERPASPSLVIPPEEFVPVFPRRKRNTGPSWMPENITELPIPLLDSIDSEPIDFLKENMLLVDGWNTIPPISSPPPVSSPSSSQNIDEIFAFSSPNTSPSHIPKLQPMDVPPMPRRKSIKGSQARKPNEEKYTDFMRLQLPVTSVVDHTPSSPQPTTSLLGQEGTTLDDIDDFGADVSSIYANVQGDDPADVIMKATLNPTQKVFWLAPALPRPNEHPPNALQALTSLCQLAMDGNVTSGMPVFAKKVKGLKALNLTLPWTPFGSCGRLPTNFEATNCTSILEGGSTTLAQNINNTLESLALPVQTSSDDERWQRFDESTTENRPVHSDNTLEIVLSRRARRGHSSQPHVVEPVGGNSHLPQPDQDDLHLAQGYPVKRPRTHLSHTTPTRHPLHDDDSGYFDMSPPQDAVEESAFYGYPEDYLSGVEQTQLQIDAQEETRQFVPLGFDDSQDNLAYPRPQNQPAEPPASHLDVQPERVRHTDPSDELFPEQLDHRVGLSDFLRLRIKTSNNPDLHPIAVSQPVQEPVVPQQPPTEETPTAPPDIYDNRTLRLPETMALPGEEHLYLVSLDLAQKNVLLRYLRAPDCAVDLVERDTLDDADIIMDAETAVIFASLVTLPSQRESLIERVAQQSWRYGKMLILFEAYPESRAYKASEGAETFNVYTPATLKALGRFRRDLNLSIACKKMDEKCVVQLAFAANVHEAALFVRHYGDLAAQEDGTMWGDRAWLDGDPAPEEDSLSAVPRMNRFAAYTILNQMDVDSFLALLPQERMHMLGRFVGEARMESVNAYIEERTRSLEESSDPAGYGVVDEASEYY